MKRRNFLKGASALGIGIGIVGYSTTFGKMIAFRDSGKSPNYKYYGNSSSTEWLLGKNNNYEINPDYAIRHSVCLQCHSECGIRAKVNIKTGNIERIFGNPYHPTNLIDYRSTTTPISQTADNSGTICPRGNTGLQTAYDPYRVTKPLKRTGKRGENRWKSISWEQFIKEVVYGGKIFSDTNDVASKDLTINGFKHLYDRREEWIDPKNHDLGRVTNKFVIQGGRVVKSRKDFQTRFCKSFGTINNYEHTNICELSHHIATGAVYHGKHNLKADLKNTKFAIFFGTAPGEANFPMQTMAKYSAIARARGAKIVTVNPALPRTITDHPNMKWVPIKPGTDGALAAGMLKVIIRDKRYNTNYLIRPNMKAAKLAGELTYTDFSHLIITDKKNKNYAKFLTMADIGRGTNSHVVIDKKSNKAESSSISSEAVLDYSGTINGIDVATSFNLMKKSVFKYSLNEYSKDSGVSVSEIESLAHEFTNYGRKACAELYRGIAQHPNGYITAFTIYQLNQMIGNLNWKGGATLGAGSLNYNSGLYDLKKIPNLVKADYGLHLTREQAKYEDSKEYKNIIASGKNPYPAKRPWFPHAKDIFSEIIPSALEGYPYKIDILLWHMSTPFYSTPAMGTSEIIDSVKDPKNIPLIISSDIVIGDSSMYADYILPDITYLERFIHHPTLEATMAKGTAVRSPVIEPLTEKTKTGLHFSYEQFLIDVAKELNMAGFGKDALVSEDGKMWPLNKMEDYYLKATANLAFNGGSVGNITKEDLNVTKLDMLYKDKKDSLRANEWLPTLNVLAHGGRFESPRSPYIADKIAYQYNGLLNSYNEKVATSRNSITGKRFNAIASYEPATTANGSLVSNLDRDKKFTIISKKTPLQSHSRLVSNTYIRELVPVNYVEINASVGKKMGLKTGDNIFVKTATGSQKAKVKLLEGIAPDIANFEIGYGHKGYGATQININGKEIEANALRGAGVNLNPIMKNDPNIKNMPLMDFIGGSCSFYNTKADIKKA